MIVDVREPHEFHFAQDWLALGLGSRPENIPLTRLSGFLQRLLSQGGQAADRDIIFICRSGNRSGKAAEVLRRVGIQRAWNIRGGIALGGRPQSGASSDEIDYVI